MTLEVVYRHEKLALESVVEFRPVAPISGACVRGITHGGKIKAKTRKRAVAKALHLEGHPDFAPVDLAYYQHFLGFFVRKYCILGSSAWQPQMQSTWRHAPSQR